MASTVFESTTGDNIEMTQRSSSAPSVENSNPPIENPEYENEQVDSYPLLRAADSDGDGISDDERLVSKDYDGLLSERDSIFRPLWKSWPLRVAAGCFLSAVAAAVILLSLGFGSRLRNSNGEQISTYWQGFEQLDTYFAFGDSWTTTHFYIAGDQPSVENPFGNPAFPGYTSSNGMNYVGYLATQYNQSFIKIYDLAWAGATIDGEIDKPGYMDWLDLVHEVKDEFIAHYTTVVNGAEVPAPLDWKPENTLFSMFFGINDIMVFNRSNPRRDKVFNTYESLMSTIYEAGGRNFLIMNLPPLELCPTVTNNNSPEEIKVYKAAVLDHNHLVRTLSQHLRNKYTDITVFEYDMYDLFQRVIANPAILPQTAGYKDTMKFCEEYQLLELGAEPTKEQIDSCGGLLPDEYLWLNALHVSPPIHDAMAAEMQKLLLNATTSASP